MADVLETIMLLCFGLSWPVSLVKNIRARSAKGMSLPFTLLIMMGYVAGIIAKISSGAVHYVLLVYFWNLLLVSMNLVVYGINKQYDRKSKS